MYWQIARKKTDRLLDQLLINRRINLKNKERFLSPRLIDLYDPFLMPDIDRAIKILIGCQKRRFKVAIFGDYDADGITSAVLTAEILKELKLRSVVYIPSREEGYGLSKKAVDYFLKEHCRLMITVDCGVANLEEISYAKERGLKVIILDHHELKKDLPEAEAVVDPKRAEAGYPDKFLSAAGVVFKLGQALAEKGLLEKKFLKRSLDLVAISTISDMVPLIDENRIFAHWGLVVLRQTERIGLKALFDRASIIQREISDYTIGFQIGPRFNAPGRLDHSNFGYHLLTAANKDQAAVLAEKIERLNQKRQQKIEEVYQQALKQIKKDRLDQKKLIMIKGEKWPRGIVGLVANRIKDKFNRPVIALSQKENFSEGSCRSIASFNILAALDDSRRFLVSHGGHKAAAGLKVKNEYLDNLYENLIEYADKNIDDQDLISKLKIDAVIKFNEINQRLLSQLKKLQPHGISNPTPLFVSRDVRLKNFSTVGKEGKHLKLLLGQGGLVLPGIFFNYGRADDLRENLKIDLAYTINENIYNGQKTIDLHIKDLKIKDDQK